MGNIAVENLLKFDHFLNAIQQTVLRIHQRRKLCKPFVVLQTCGKILIRADPFRMSRYFHQRTGNPSHRHELDHKDQHPGDKHRQDHATADFPVNACGIAVIHKTDDGQFPFIRTGLPPQMPLDPAKAVAHACPIHKMIPPVVQSLNHFPGDAIRILPQQNGIILIQHDENQIVVLFLMLRPELDRPIVQIYILPQSIEITVQMPPEHAVRRPAL